MPTSHRQDRIHSVIQNRQQGIVVFEDIYDPHNAAAVLRTMDGFGFQTAYFIFDTQKKYNPKKVGKGSSSSANKWLTVETFSSAKECYEKLKNDGYTILATALVSEKPLDLYHDEIPQTPKLALVFGNEHAGLSEYAITRADATVHIPMLGFVESFNISVMAALVLGEITRRRGVWGAAQRALPRGRADYLLTPEEQDRLKEEWLR